MDHRELNSLLSIMQHSDMLDASMLSQFIARMHHVQCCET